MKEKIIPKYLEEEVKDSYLSYAMSVIMGRALPDVRDGLKPVQRRILYTMHELNLRHNQPFKKSARIVGECLGKFHPHGDMAVYEALVRMAQDFSLRYSLIQGQGNFGSIDGDPAAAMRYTEARLAKISNYMLADIEKDTVDFVPNFDNTLSEPVVLPAVLPNLLVNGTSGIAVGMATSMPPHNLLEVIDGIIYYLENPDCKIKELMKFIKGPDFPTGGIICGRENILKAYQEGKGRIILRGRVEVEEQKSKRRIVITEIPYQINKSQFLENIANLVSKKVIEGIQDLRDESDKEGMRIVIELKREANPQIILNRLYKYTQLETTFSIINLAIVEGRPKVLNLKELIRLYVDHRKEVIIRKTRFELEKAKKRAHILEGLKKALKIIDLVISIIKKSKTPQEAKEKLIKKLELTEIQAQSILEMQLQRLTNLEQRKINEEYLEIIKKIEYLERVLSSEEMVKEIIKEELLTLKKEFKDKRKTEIMEEIEKIDIEDLIPQEEVVITLTHTGYIKRQPLDTYREQRNQAKGLLATQMSKEDFLEHLFLASTKDYILIFTNKGKVFWLKVYNIPEGSRISKGRALVNFINLTSNEKVRTIISLKEVDKESSLILATKKGFIKKLKVKNLGEPKRKGIIVISLDKDDDLVGAGLVRENFDVILATKKGLCIRFSESEVRKMGRSAKGVRGISLAKDDQVIGMVAIDRSLERETTLLTFSEKGLAKRTELSEYRFQKRGGKGLINFNVSEKTGKVVGILIVKEEDQVMLITQKGILKRINVFGIRVTKRATQGVKVIKLGESDLVSSVARIVSE